jgi:hypothetical protein
MQSNAPCPALGAVLLGTTSTTEPSGLSCFSVNPVVGCASNKVLCVLGPPEPEAPGGSPARACGTSSVCDGVIKRSSCTSPARLRQASTASWRNWPACGELRKLFALSALILVMTVLASSSSPAIAGLVVGPLNSFRRAFEPNLGFLWHSWQTRGSNFWLSAPLNVLFLPTPCALYFLLARPIPRRWTG